MTRMQKERWVMLFAPLFAAATASVIGIRIGAVKPNNLIICITALAVGMVMNWLIRWLSGGIRTVGVFPAFMVGLFIPMSLASSTLAGSVTIRALAVALAAAAMALDTILFFIHHRRIKQGVRLWPELMMVTVQLGLFIALCIANRPMLSIIIGTVSFLQLLQAKRSPDADAPSTK